MREIFLFSLLVIVMFFIVASGIKSHEQLECIRWQEEKEQYKHWHSTSWQVEQCKHYGIDL